MFAPIEWLLRQPMAPESGGGIGAGIERPPGRVWDPGPHRLFEEGRHARYQRQSGHLRTRRLLLLFIGGTGQEVAYRVITDPRFYGLPVALYVIDDDCIYPELQPYFVRIRKRRAVEILRELRRGSGRYPYFARYLRYEKLPEIRSEPGAQQEGVLGHLMFLATVPALADRLQEEGFKKLLISDLAEHCAADGYELEEDRLYVIRVGSACGGTNGGSLSLPIGLAAREALKALGLPGAYDVLDQHVHMIDLVCDYQPFLGLEGVKEEKVMANTGVFLADLLRQATLEPGEEFIVVEGLDGQLERIPEGIPRLTFWLSGHRSASDEQFAAVIPREAVYRLMADFVLLHNRGNLVSEIYRQYANLTARAVVRGQPAILSTFGLPQISFDAKGLQELLAWRRTERVLGRALYGTAPLASSLFGLGTKRTQTAQHDWEVEADGQGHDGGPPEVLTAEHDSEASPEAAGAAGRTRRDLEPAKARSESESGKRSGEVPSLYDWERKW